MKIGFSKFVLAVAAAALLSGCVTGSSEDYGSGPIELSYNIQDRFANYLNDRPAVFAVAENGYSGYAYYHCQQPVCSGTNNQSIFKALRDCKNYSFGTSCKVYALGTSIVWKGQENRTDFKTVDDLAAIDSLPMADRSVKLDSRQLSELRNFQNAILEREGRQGAYVIPASGTGARWHTYTRPNSRNARKLAAHDAFWRCETVDKRECVVFAINDEVVSTGQSIDEYLASN